MTKLDTNKLQAIREDMTAAMAALLKKHDLATLNVGNCTYDPSGSFTFKIDGSIKGGLTKEGALYNSMRSFHTGLPALESTFQHKGNTYTIVGSNTTGTKIKVTRDGHKYEFTTEQVLSLVTKK